MNLSQNDLNSLANNPSRGITMIINGIEKSWNRGTIEINSKTHPAVLCIDVSIATTHGFLNRLSDACSKKFLLHARNIEDLSRNIADEERYGLFANPATSWMWFMIDVNNLNEIAVPVQEVDNQVTNTYKKLLIPKDTIIEVTGYDFMIENGIEIRYNERTGYQVVYDSTTNNPFNPISTNLLEREFKEANGRRYLMVEVPVRQLSCAPSDKLASTSSSGCSGVYTYTDYLYGVRAFLTTPDNVTKEIRVSYDQDTFDPITVTLALQLDTVNKKIKFEIPDVYIVNELGLGTVVIYTYTTKGILVKDLMEIDTAKYVPTYLDNRYPGNTLSVYSKGLPTSGGVAWQFGDIVSGGANPIPFTVMKQAIIDGRRQQSVPITDANLTGTVENYGYGSVLSVDLLTGRRYALTKELPIQQNKGLYSTMNCFVGSHLTSVNQLLDAGIAYDNGPRVTVPPGVLFDVTTPTTVLVNEITKNGYLALSADGKVDLLTTNTLVYTPFYYVFDLTNDQTVLRTYHLDDPKFLHQSFVAENTNLALEVGVGEMDIVHTPEGYVITLKTKSGKGYKELQNNEVSIQLSWDTPDATQPACMAATFLGIDEEGERIFEFRLNSRYDVDVNDILYINDVTQFGQPKDNAGIKLTDEVCLIFTVGADSTVPSTSMDGKLEQSLFDRTMMAIIETHYKLELGMLLDNIYSRIRPMKGDDIYLRYEYDVYATHQVTTYQRTDDGKLVIDPETGLPAIEHLQGDVIYDGNGNPVIQYRAGIDYVVGADGQPVVKEPADLMYHWDFIGFDGAYYFSNDTYDLDFAQQTKDYFIKVISKDMTSFNADALDRTILYYQPISKIGYRSVMANNNYETMLRQDLNFEVTYYLNNSGFNNLNLKDALRESTPQIINDLLLNATTLSMSDITNALRESAGTDVVDVKLGAFAGDVTLDVVSNLDSTSGFSVRKLLEAGSDGLLSTTEAIDITFLEHDVRKKY